MTLTFPRAMPTEGIDDIRFEPVRSDLLSPELGGRVGAVAVGFPLWRLELTLGDMDRADADAWRAFLRSLRGSARTFYGWDLLRPYPKAYPAGFDGLVRAGTATPLPSNGAPTSWSVNTARDVLTLNGMPADFFLGEGDLVGFAWDTDHRTVAAAVEDVTGTGAGVVEVAIEPALPTLVPSDATVTLYRPAAVMRIVTDDSRTAPEDSISTKGGRIVAVQNLT